MDSQKIYDDFISKYPIYQDNRVFKILINKFKDVFVKDIYDDIPKIFKQLYENNEIPSDVYDYFLIDIGVSEDLIKELSNPEKLIFIKSLSDFQKYKSTVKLVRNVVQAYGDSVEVYELYVDYDKIQNTWECKPYLIYKPEFSDGSYNKSIPYKIVYEKVPTLLIHEKQLDQMRLDNIGIFPIKTNIIFLNSNYNQSVTSFLQNLIISVFYNTYSEETINLYFVDQLIPCTLYEFILLWLYLIFIDNNSSLDNKLSDLYVCFNKDTTIHIEDLEDIINEYENIGTCTTTRSCAPNEILLSELDEFYYKYIKPNEIKISESNLILDKNKIRNILKIKNKKLIDYIDNEINIKNIDTSFIFNILINSLQVYQKTNASLDFIKYFKYFKSFLPSINVLPLQNTMYKILYYVKPFHTEILNNINVSFLTSEDVFNNIYFTHFYRPLLFFSEVDIFNIEIFHSFLLLKLVLENLMFISILSKFSSKISFSDSLNENDEFNCFAFIPFLENVISDLYKVFLNSKPICDNYIITDYIISECSCLIKIEEDEFINDDLIQLYPHDNVEDYFIDDYLMETFYW